jgi:GAF domain-containing protein
MWSIVASLLPEGMIFASSWFPIKVKPTLGRKEPTVMFSGDNGAAMSLDNVLGTTELALRPSRTPDYKGQANALAELSQTLVTSPGTVLQELADNALVLCRAESAGISILEPGGDRGIIRWHAAAGVFAAHVGSTMPRAASPCGIVMDRDATLVFAHAERQFHSPDTINAPLTEALVTPFHTGRKPAGTVWLISHTTGRQFDAEDARLLQSLSPVASAAWQLVTMRDAAAANVTASPTPADLVAGHVSSAVANARAFEGERRRAEALAELDRAKTAFFSEVSHEFRALLALILGPLKDALAETMERRQVDRLQLLHRNALRLQKLFNTLLDFHRIEAGRATHEATDLAQRASKLGRRSAIVDTNGSRPQADPTTAQPGTPEKVAVLIARAAARQSLFHPQDPTVEPRAGSGALHFASLSRKIRQSVGRDPDRDLLVTK